MENDFIINGVATGSVAAKLLANGMNPGAMRPYIGEDGKAYITANGKHQLVANATLRYDEWKAYDKVILQVALARLNGVADLISRGLTYGIPNGLATTVLQYEDQSKMGEAVISMDGLNKSKSDRPEYSLKYLPLPIIHSDFSINARVLAASRTGGSPLDTVSGEQAGKRVAEKLETILFQGSSSYAYGGGTIYGYTDFPSRITGKLSSPWDESPSTGASILADVSAMKQAAINAKQFGPYVLYVPTVYEVVLDQDYNPTYSTKTIRQRLLELGGIQDIKVADYLTSTHVLLVQMSSDTVRLVQGMGITPIEWEAEGGMVTHYKVMTIQVPQIRADQEGNCGIVDYSE